MTLTQQPVHLDTLLSSVIGLVYNRSHDQGLEIYHKNESKIETFVGDERRLKQAVFNLLSNAIKYTPSGGRIELKAYTKQREEGQELCLSMTRAWGLARKTVPVYLRFLSAAQTTVSQSPLGLVSGFPLSKAL